MENELEFLFAGFAVFWAGLFVYLILLQVRLRSLQREVETLEERLAEYEGSATAPATETAGTRGTGSEESAATSSTAEA